MIRRIKKKLSKISLFVNLYILAVFVLSYIVPKRRGLVSFFPLHSRNNFSGNLKALFIYAHERDDPAVKKVWFSGSPDCSRKIGELGYLSSFWNGVGFLGILRSEVIITDTCENRFKGNFTVVQLWHGTGYKNIGVMDKLYPPNLFLGNEFSNYRIFVANSPADKKRKEKSFPGADVQVLGSPRLDSLFSEKNNDLVWVKKKYGLSHYDFVVVYVPTYRQGHEHISFSDSFWSSLVGFLSEKNAVFILKRHPYDETLSLPLSGRVIDLTGTVDDVQDLLGVADILISDYSGIVTDYSALRRPVIFDFRDYANYIRSGRDFYYDLEKLLPGPLCYHETEILDFLKDLTWFYDEEYAFRYEEFRSTFHSFVDEKSSERVWNQVLGLLK